MRHIIFVIVFSAALVWSGCGSYQKKNDAQFSPGATDVSVKIKDESFSFKRVKKIYLYTERNGDKEKPAMEELKKLLTEKGYVTIQDGYDGADLVLRPAQDLMTFMVYIKILKAGGQKTNEETIAVIGADSPEKAAKEAVNFLVSR